ncbi:dynein heavy chain and region D6 of dynein motor-domain-containing protein, partial [Dunaliella salina]
MQPRAFLPAAKWAVGAILGPACTVAEPVELDNAFPMSSATMPIVLISSTDQPLPQLMLFAEQQVVKVHHMAIGRGQGASADKLVRNSVRDPVWVVLENTHLAGDYMPQLCSLVQALPTMSPHYDFRLWLTTVPSEEFPGVILQAALKLVMDPPAGLQSNLVSVMSALPRDIMAKVGAAALPQANPEDLASFSTNTGMVAPGKSGPPSPIPQPLAFAASRPKVPEPTAPPPPLGMEWKMLVLRLCLFHAILLERRHYKALSFRRPYDFSAADFLSTIKQVQQIHKELMSSASALAPGGDLEAVNRALPGLLYVDGQCLYGGKVSQDWDRRLLVSLLQQQLMPGCAPNPCGDITLPHVDMLMPSVKKHLSAGVLTEMYQLENVIKEVRLLHLDPADPTLVGLTAGASVVRQAQQTRHTLNILKRVQLMQSNDSEAGSQPMQVALSMAQDLTRQLPFTVLPTVVSAWAAMVQGKVPQNMTPQRPSMPPSSSNTVPADSTAQQQQQQQQQQHKQGMAEGGTKGMKSALRGTTAATEAGEGADQHRSKLKHSVTMAEGPDAEAKGWGGNKEDGGSNAPGSSAGTAGAAASAGAANAGATASAAAAAAAGGKMERPKPAGSARAVNRARQLKMTETISEQALARWQAMGEYERKMMVQVFEAEVLCYQAVL